MLVGKDRANLCLRTDCRCFDSQDGHIATFPTSHCRDATQPVSCATVAQGFPWKHPAKEAGRQPGGTTHGGCWEPRR